MGEEEDDWLDYETGPFCRHWMSPPCDCEERCARCGVLCNDHYDDDACEWLDAKGTRET